MKTLKNTLNKVYGFKLTSSIKNLQYYFYLDPKTTLTAFLRILKTMLHVSDENFDILFPSMPSIPVNKSKNADLSLEMLIENADLGMFWLEEIFLAKEKKFALVEVGNLVPLTIELSLNQREHISFSAKMSSHITIREISKYIKEICASISYRTIKWKNEDYLDNRNRQLDLPVGNIISSSSKSRLIFQLERDK